MGMVGKIDDLEHRQQSHFTHQGDQIYLLGDTREDMGGSIYLEQLGFSLQGPCPKIDLEQEKALQDQLLELIHRGLIESAHDLSEGGLAFALAESCYALNCGVSTDIATDLRPDYLCFSESPSRVVVSVSQQQEPDFLEAIARFPSTKLGEVGGKNLEISINSKIVVSVSIQKLFGVWDRALDEVFSGA